MKKWLVIFSLFAENGRASIFWNFILVENQLTQLDFCSVTVDGEIDFGEFARMMKKTSYDDN